MQRLRTPEIQVEATSLGAELTSIKSADGTELLWQGDPAFWARRSPLLFPIVGGLPGGTYSHKGTTYKLGNHGFARELQFTVVEEAPDRVTYEAAAGDGTLAAYPFHFTLRVSYRAAANRLQVAWTVRNDEAREPMIFSIGAHPGFRAPLADGETRGDFEIVFEKPERVRRHFLGDGNVRTVETEPFLAGGDRVTVTPSLFDKGAIVLTDHVSRQLTLRSRISGRYVTVRFAGFPYLGIWSPRPDAPFVCLEPWHGVMPLAGSPQELGKKEGCLRLAPGLEFHTSYEIEAG